jgi:riboflavin kinase / FMN adenylyltransferase
LQPPGPRTSPPASVVAIGNFDGVHLGHRALLHHLFEAASRHSAVPTVYTFDPAPTAVVAPQRHQARLQTLENRVRCLRELGVQHVEVEPFTPAFAALSAPQFVRDVLSKRLGARALVVGHDFRFGSMRSGDAAAIRRLMPTLELVEVGAVEAAGAPISSSRIRKLLKAGEVAAAAALLGRPWSVSGPVVHGLARGRTIGFPTANVAQREELEAATGVYAVRATLPDGRMLPGVANLGVRPTLGGSVRSVEAHLFDFEGDLYGQVVSIELLSRLRFEQKFDGIEPLVAQIRADVQATKAWFA